MCVPVEGEHIEFSNIVFASLVTPYGYVVT